MMGADIAKQIASAVSFLYIDLSFLLTLWSESMRPGSVARCNLDSLDRTMRASPVRRQPARLTHVRRAGLLARGALTRLNFTHDLVEVVAGRVLHRRKLLVRLKFLQPQRLANG